MTKTEGCYYQHVEMPSEAIVGITTPDDPAGTPLETSFETEKWYRYEPCGCVIPPEEHQELTEDRSR